MGYITERLCDIWKLYPNAGLSSVRWTEDCPNLFENKDMLIDLFETKFAFREIGNETVDVWQWYINRKFDEIKLKYEKMFAFEKENDISDSTRLTKNTGTSGTIIENETIPLPKAGVGNYKDNRSYDKREYDNTIQSNLSNLDKLKAMKTGLITISNDFISEFDRNFISTVGRLPEWHVQL